jgi:hypothetical protein
MFGRDQIWTATHRCRTTGRLISRGEPAKIAMNAGLGSEGESPPWSLPQVQQGIYAPLADDIATRHLCALTYLSTLKAPVRLLHLGPLTRTMR